ncbi:MAG: hypothetical protein EPO32_05705 [Anaerolineae bacterium]|nr:MAG: hypothetical protein EPO32_05705 [Anaerolineae bacterium]
MTTNRFLRKHVALPSDHGAWVFLLSPLLIGIFVVGTVHRATLVLCVAALGAFLLRQPVSTLVKVFAQRRGRADLPATWLWASVYGAVCLLALVWLWQNGYGFVIGLAIPGLLVFGWHLWLVAQREERGKLGMDVVASGALALAAPAAYWVGTGVPDALGWWLWGLTWLQSAASIVYAFLRLEQRGGPPSVTLVRRALSYSGFNLLLSAGLSASSIFPPALWLPFALQFIETVYGVRNPATGYRPVQIGVRQLVVSSVFTVLFIWVWRL